MGILDKKNDKIIRNKTTTKGFYFGATEAEAENVPGSSLINFFEDYLNIFNDLENGKFIFTGRKGVGKSAIAKFIKDSSETNDESYAKLIRINDFELEKIIQTQGDEFHCEQLIFEWIILVNIVKLIVHNNCSQYTTEYKKLQKFLNINSGIVNIDGSVKKNSQTFLTFPTFSFFLKLRHKFQKLRCKIQF